MKKIIKNLLTNKLSLFLRNNLNIKPLGYTYLKKNVISVSDFFYWNTREGYNTKINITNLASQVLPDIQQNCNVIFIFFNSLGKIIFQKEIILEYFDSFSFDVSEYCKNDFGSVAIFQSFKNFEELEKHGSYVTEKGYVGYNHNNGPWNYVHGNNSSLSYTINKNIHPLLSSTLFKTNSYVPQVRLDDCRECSLIFNNPLNISLRSSIILFDYNWKLLKKIDVNTKPKNTVIFKLGNFDKSYVKIKSNMLLFRPMIFKQYQTYFDIFHG